MKPGIALRTPYLRASYDAVLIMEMPPTAKGTPRRLGSSSAWQEAKKASMSMHAHVLERMRCPSSSARTRSATCCQRSSSAGCSRPNRFLYSPTRCATLASRRCSSLKWSESLDIS